MTRIVALGGTGFIGRSVVRALAARGGEVDLAVVSRSKSSGARTGARVIACDLIEEGPTPELTEALRLADLVTYSIQFPGHPVENTRKGYTYARYDAGGMRRVLEGPLAGVATRVVYLSGAGAGQGRSEPWYRAKDAAEDALSRWAAASGGTYASLRPSLVVGKEDVSVNRIYDAARLTHLCPLFGRGDVRVHPIWVEDLARAVVEFGVGRHKGVSGAFDLPGPQEITFKDLLATMFRVGGVRAAFLQVPLGVAKAGASVLSLLPSPPLTPAAIDFLTTGPEMPLPADPAARTAVEELRAGFARPAEAFETYLRGG